MKKSFGIKVLGSLLAAATLVTCPSAFVLADYSTEEKDGKNLALTATAADGGYAYYGNHILQCVNDGDVGTGWQHNDSYVLNGGDLRNCFVSYDFGQATRFNKAVIEWEYGTKCTEDGFEIQYSDDGINWISVADTVLTYGDTSIVEFATVTAQYIRVNMTKGTNIKYCPKIFEFEVYYNMGNSTDVIQTDLGGDEVYTTALDITNPAADYGLADPEIRRYKDENGNDVYWIYGTLNEADNIGAIYSTDNMKTWQKATDDGKVLDKSTFPWAEFSFWAPGAIELNGKYYVVFSANNVPDSYRTGGIGLGVSDNPAGPFKAVEGSNDGLIVDPSFYGVTGEETDEEFKAKFAGMPTLIDANLFVDDDGQVYLYYGGGGQLAVCLMNDEMNGIKAFPDGDMFKVITEGLNEYVEGPFMIKRGGTYYMMYSKGMWSGGSYASCYGISDSPIGPFRDSRQILQSSQGDYPYRGPGHNSAIYIPENNMWLICYHRYNYGSVDRRPCIDRMIFNEDGSIRAVIQTDSWTTDDYFGPDLTNLALNATAIDSGYNYYGSSKASNINDWDQITFWQFSDSRVINSGVLTDCWVGYDFGSATAMREMVIQWESGTKCTEDGFEVQYSDDGSNWSAVSGAQVEYGDTTVINFDTVNARYIRVNMTRNTNDKYCPKVYEMEIR